MHEMLWFFIDSLSRQGIYFFSSVHVFNHPFALLFFSIFVDNYCAPRIKRALSYVHMF